MNNTRQFSNKGKLSNLKIMEKFYYSNNNLY